ncbi:hypothetical protein Pla52o_22050 [Novipirellula galeiformis]|uniref:Uncharacterized protein n=1 Tax=Novipirellula galeiformis TaxID=2528004 RepID=A0A5C6CIK5_9BACT|nr:hypothetical protein [Novipirellula galeiformis]TWU24278.1 hypothetical protein Pla52o_22050 [Novipirellula galeiformis]
MSANEMLDLLSLPSGTQNPHPYQVFSLVGGEQDAEVINAAIKKTIRKLQDAKGTADPADWKRAAKWVQQSRDILLDPVKKKELDVRFGVIELEELPPPPGAAAPISAPAAVPPPPGAAVKADPLVGLLPKADPLAALLPQGNPLAAASPVAATPVIEMPAVPVVPVPAANPSPGNDGLAAAGNHEAASFAAAPVAIKKKAPKRRRKSRTGLYVSMIFGLAMIAMIGALVWVINVKPGTIAITAKDGSFTVSTDQGSDKSLQAETPRSPSQGNRSRAVDPIMGSLAPATRNGSGSNNPRGSFGDTQGGMGGLGGMDAGDSNPMEMSPEPNATNDRDDAEVSSPMESMETTVPAPTTPGPAMTPPDTPEPAPAAPSVPELSEEMVAKGEELIAKARTAIKSSDWKQIKAVHDAAADTAFTPEQQMRAGPLLEIADLASYYRGAIERGVGTLDTGSDFEVTENLRVIVVEKGPDRLVIRFNAKIKEYAFDELPPRLAEKVASFALKEGDPAVIASQAVYQAIAPNSNDAYRQAAIQTLEAMTAEVEGASPKQIAVALRDLLASSP